VFTVVHLLTPDTLTVPERKKRNRKGGRNLFCFSTTKTAASKAMVFIATLWRLIEDSLVMRALVQTQGSRAAAAKSLGLHQEYFLRLIKALGIS